MLNTYIVEGGIGKCIAFSALIPALAEKAGEPIQVLTPYPNCFGNNQLVKLSFDENSVSIGHPEIQKSDNILYCEPYKSNFVFGKEHLIESYCKHFDVEYTEDMKPQLFTGELVEESKKLLSNIGVGGKYMMVQFTGGQSPINMQHNPQYMSHMPLRNYPQYLAQEVINKIKEEYPTLTIIDFSLPNEPRYENTVKFEGHWILAHELLKNAQGFIGIDSMLQHMSGSTGTKGVVLWGQSRWVQFGYKHNINLSFHQSEDWDEELYAEPDPRNICVDPEIVFEAYKKTMI